MAVTIESRVGRFANRTFVARSQSKADLNWLRRDLAGLQFAGEQMQQPVSVSSTMSPTASSLFVHCHISCTTRAFFLRGSALLDGHFAGACACGAVAEYDPFGANAVAVALAFASSTAIGTGGISSFHGNSPKLQVGRGFYCRGRSHDEIGGGKNHRRPSPRQPSLCP